MLKEDASPLESTWSVKEGRNRTSVKHLTEELHSLLTELGSQKYQGASAHTVQ